MTRLLHKGASLFVYCVLFLVLQAEALSAQQPAKIVYIYDDLGRLIRVIDTSIDQCATYEYDAVGNILSITRSTNCLQSPTIASVSQASGREGETTCITITGMNLLGATVTTNDPEIAISQTRVSDTTIEVCLTISFFASVGNTTLTIATAAGAVQQIFRIDPKSVVISQSTLIRATDLSFDGADLTIDGPVTVTFEGSHRFASLALLNGVVVTHAGATSASTSRLDLTIDGTLTIDTTSKIDVTGKGFVGALAPGLVCQPFVNPPEIAGCHGRTLGNLPGSRTNASHGGIADGVTYGDFRQPVDVGSGGGAFGCAFGCQRGGSGGGAVKITAGAVLLSGSILANGEKAGYAGSGGSIWLTTGTLSGSGVIETNGATSGDLESSSGGGRVAIYYSDASGFDLSHIRAAAGAANSSNPTRPPIFSGGAGTVFIKSSADTFGRLILNNLGRSTTPPPTPIRSVGSGTSSSLTATSLFNTSASFPVLDPVIGTLGLKGLKLNPNTSQAKTFTIIDNTATTLFTDPIDGDMITVATQGNPYGGVEQLDAMMVAGKASFSLGDSFLPNTTVSVNNAQIVGTSLTGGAVQFSNNALVEVQRVQAATLDLTLASTLTHPATTKTQEFSLTIQVSGLLSIDATSSIDVSRRGYLGADNEFVPARTLGNTTNGGSGGEAGGGHGGLGGRGAGSNRTYGDFTAPTNPGSGGAGVFPHFVGSFGGPGSKGGGVIRIVTDSLLLDGVIAADGDFNGSGGAGAGGSIWITTRLIAGTGRIHTDGASNSSSFTGAGAGGRVALYYDDATGFSFTNVTAAGGAGPNPAGAGTVFLKSTAQTRGDLIVDNSGTVAPANSTLLRAIGSATSTALTANVLTNTTATFRTPNPATGEIGLSGLELNPNSAQGQTFTVVDNTATTLTTDAADGDMTFVATPGNPYIGVYTFDDLTVSNGAKMVTADNCVVLGTVTVVGGSVTCNNLAQ